MVLASFHRLSDRADHLILGNPLSVYLSRDITPLEVPLTALIAAATIFIRLPGLTVR